jgi:hypothetical protein
MTNHPKHLARALLAATFILFAIVGMAGPQQRLNGSSDGRYHTCGYVTEDGVTEHLAAYASRCGQ